MACILIVDDNPEVREAAAWCIRDHGSSTIFAENGREALKIFAKHRPDAVLTDLHMPEMDGLELTEHMRREHSHVPVVLMTSRGGEQAAFNALRAGALSYVPKKELRSSLCDALRTVMAAVEARRLGLRAPSTAGGGASHFVLGYEQDTALALVSHLQKNLEQSGCCDDTGIFQVSTALGEAFTNAIEHGNLELNSALREEPSDVYSKLRQERCVQQPYRDRRVHVTEWIGPDATTYVVSDEGKGFDLSTVPDPTDPKNLLKASGRGLMLIRTFMDEVTFNDVGNEITMVKRRTSVDSIL